MTTLMECYEKAGGNYEDALSRLMSESLVSKFVRKFPADESFAQVKGFLSEGNLDEAFRAAHTLKGVAYNLSLTKLGDAASSLTEALRPGNEDQRTQENLDALLAVVDQEYANTVAAINELD